MFEHDDRDWQHPEWRREHRPFPHEHGWREHHGPRHSGRGRHGDHAGPRNRGPLGRRPSFWFGREDDWFGDRPFRGRGPFGGPPSDEDGGGRQRHRRGDIKYVLLELIAEQPRHGYELIKALEQRYAGFYRPSPGTVYPTLQLLEDEGSVVSEPIEGKRVYTITDAGRSALEAHRQQQNNRPGPWQRGGRGGPHPELEALRHSSMALMTSIMQAARLPVGGTDAFTTIRIGNHALRMIDGGIAELVGRR